MSSGWSGRWVFRPGERGSQRAHDQRWSREYGGCGCPRCVVAMVEWHLQGLPLDKQPTTCRDAVRRENWQIEEEQEGPTTADPLEDDWDEAWGNKLDDLEEEWGEQQ